MRAYVCFGVWASYVDLAASHKTHTHTLWTEVYESLCMLLCVGFLCRPWAALCQGLLIELARTVYIHTVYDRIFGDFSVKNTV
jgi:hypothetical protein